MTTTAFDDQFTVGTQPIEPVREPMSREAILRRNVADLELALKQQTERAEAAEAELLAIREDNHSMMLEIHNLRIERDALAGELVEAAPSVLDILNALSDVLFESARPDVPAERLECPDEWSDEHKQTFSRWVHEEMQNNARRSIIKRARTLLQSLDAKESLTTSPAELLQSEGCSSQAQNEVRHD